MSPKVSVLIPLYNRKHYIAMCIDSALNQTFQDFEIIVRDNCSTDGSFDFVKERYSKQISEGKIKLFQNDKNLGEFPNTNKLIATAEGKYFTILHSDDLYLPHALQHLYEVAEQFQADVVHGSYRLMSPKDGVIQEGTQLIPHCIDTKPVQEITVVSDDPMERFYQWVDNGTFVDLQYNMFNRKFFLSECLCPGAIAEKMSELHVLHLYWIMKSKIFVKTPVVFYVRREAPDSWSNNTKKDGLNIREEITRRLNLCQNFEHIFCELKFFDEHPEQVILAKMKFMSSLYWELVQRGLYRDGITPEIDKAVRESFEKFFGVYADFPTYLFHLLNVMQLNYGAERYVLENYKKNISTVVNMTSTEK